MTNKEDNLKEPDLENQENEVRISEKEKVIDDKQNILKMLI